MFKNKLIYFLIIIACLKFYNIFNTLIYQSFNIDSDSDLLIVPFMVKDFLNPNFSIFNWNLTINLYFFPDFLTYLVWIVIFNQYLLGIYFYAFIILFSLLFLIQKCIHFQNKENTKKERSDNVFLSLLILNLFLSLIEMNPVKLGLFLLSARHGGIFIIELYLILELFSTKNLKLKKLVILLFVCTLGILSDKLIITQFFIPTFFGLLFFYFFDKSNTKNFLMIILIILISWSINETVFKIFKHYKLFYIYEVPIKNIILKKIRNFFDLNTFYNNFILNKHEIYNFIKIALIFILIYIFYFVSFIYNCIKNKMQIDKINFFKIHTIFNISILFSFFSPIYFGQFSGVRYNYPLMFFPIIGLLIINKDKFKVQNHLINISILFILILSSLANFQATPIINIYPKKIECLDNLSIQYNFKNGYSDYWNAKVITFFSKNNLYTNQLYSDLSSYRWFNNQEWYTKDREGHLVFYKFIVTNGLDENKIKDEIGSPDLENKCENLNIYIYKNQNLDRLNSFQPKELFQ